MLMMAKIGRRITLGAGFLFGGLSCLGMIPLLNNKGTVKLLLVSPILVIFVMLIKLFSERVGDSCRWPQV